LVVFIGFQYAKSDFTACQGGDLLALMHLRCCGEAYSRRKVDLRAAECKFRSGQATGFFQQVQHLFAQSIVLFFQLTDAALKSFDILTWCAGIRRAESPSRFVGQGVGQSTTSGHLPNS
jgi:hypothetical protein